MPKYVVEFRSGTNKDKKEVRADSFTVAGLHHGWTDFFLARGTGTPEEREIKLRLASDEIASIEIVE